MTVILYNLENDNQVLREMLPNEYKLIVCDYYDQITEYLSNHNEEASIVITNIRGKEAIKNLFNESSLFICLDKVWQARKAINANFFDILLRPLKKEVVLDKLEKAFYHLEYRKAQFPYEMKDKTLQKDPFTELYTKDFMDHCFKTQRCHLDKSLLVIFNLEGIQLLDKVYGEEISKKAFLNITSEIKNTFPDLVISRYYKFELVGTVINNNYQNMESLLSIFSRQNVEIKDIPLPIEMITSYQYFNPKKDDVNKIISEIRQIQIESRRSHLQQNKTHYLTKLQLTLEESNQESHAHLVNLSVLTLDFTNQLNLTETNKKNLIDAVMLHDIGKLGIPKEILDKPGKLTNEEYDEIKKHPDYGYHIALFEGFPVQVAKGIRHHHERFDGTGYPSKLKGKDIPLLSRVIAILDAFEVMTRGRIYKAAMTENEAIEELNRCKGTQFDPELVEKFVKVINLKKNKKTF